MYYDCVTMDKRILALQCVERAVPWHILFRSLVQIYRVVMSSADLSEVNECSWT